MSENKFNIGDLVQHRASGWKGVVVMVNPATTYHISVDFGVVHEYVHSCELEKVQPLEPLGKLKTKGHKHENDQC